MERWTGRKIVVRVIRREREGRLGLKKTRAQKADDSNCPIKMGTVE